MSPNNTIRVLKAPCGRGKTHTYAIPRMLEGREKYIYAVPRLQLLDEFEEVVSARFTRDFQRVLRFARIDSDHISKSSSTVPTELARRLGDAFDQHTRIFGVTHHALWYLTPEMVRDRVLIIDEMPPFIDLFFEEQKAWSTLETLGLIETLPSGFLRVTEEGSSVCKGSGKGSVMPPIKSLLTKIQRAHTKRLDTGWAVQFLDPEVLRAAKEVIVMAAVPEAGYFPDYVRIQGFSTEQVIDHGLDVTPHQCPNTEIYYAIDSPRFSSKTKLEGEWHDPLRDLMARIRFPSKGGCLAAEDGEMNYLAVLNKGCRGRESLAKYLKKDRIESPGIRGVNTYDHVNVMIWLAATQPDPKELKSISLLGGVRGEAEMIAARHVESIYQFVMRGQLRKSNDAHVKILVPTKRDALALNGYLNAGLFAQCTPKPVFPGERVYTKRDK